VVIEVPSVIHPRLSNAFSLMMVKDVRGIGAPWIPDPGVAFDGESGAGLSPL
jgi:hypothetical protein